MRWPPSISAERIVAAKSGVPMKTRSSGSGVGFWTNPHPLAAEAADPLLSRNGGEENSSDKGKPLSHIAGDGGRGQCPRAGEGRGIGTEKRLLRCREVAAIALGLRELAQNHIAL